LSARHDAFPVPGSGCPTVAVPAPGAGSGNWAGAPSAALDADGTFVVAYRVRTSTQRGAAVVVAQSADGERLSTVATLAKDRFGAESLERPAIVRTAGGWRLYVCCATPGSKHWWIDVLEAAEPSELAGADARTAFPGDRHTGVKDPVIRHQGGVWHAWICCHPLDVPGEEDRMTTAHATSADGLRWRWQGTVLEPGPPGAWDARGARVTAVLPGGALAYDGRATKEENFSERTGRSDRRDEPLAGFRYLDVLELPDGRLHLAYEAPLPDGSHELRVDYADPSSDDWR
jgi:hypothetical protein